MVDYPFSVLGLSFPESFVGFAVVVALVVLAVADFADFDFAKCD